MKQLCNETIMVVHSLRKKYIELMETAYVYEDCKVIRRRNIKLVYEDYPLLKVIAPSMLSRHSHYYRALRNMGMTMKTISKLSTKEWKEIVERKK